MSLYSELCELIEALHRNWIGSNPELSLTILRQIDAILQHSDAEDFDYHYYFDQALLHRDFAEAHLAAGNLTDAEQHAILAGRHDIAGEALLAAGELARALDAFEASDFEDFSKRRCCQLVGVAKSLLGADLGEATFKQRWPALHTKVLHRYGTWASASLATTRQANTSLPKLSPAGITSPETLELAVQERRQLAAAAMRQEREDLSLVERVRSAMKRGQLAEAERQAKEILSKGTNFRYEFELEKLLWVILLLQGRFSELFVLGNGRYLGKLLDPYLCAKILVGCPMTGNDLIHNFSFLIEKRSEILAKAMPLYVEEAERVLSEFRERNGADPLEVYVKDVSSTDPGFRWVHHFFESIPRGHHRRVDKQFGRFYFISHSPEIEHLLSPLVREVDVRVRSSLGVLDPGERWKSEKALFEYVKRLLPRLRVERHAAPLWIRPQHLDIFVPDLNLGIEYMGAQHYEVVEVFGGADALEATRERDERKVAVCVANGVSLFHVRFDQPWEGVRAAVLDASAKHLAPDAHAEVVAAARVEVPLEQPTGDPQSR